MLPFLLWRLRTLAKKYKPDLIFCNSHDVVPFGVILKYLMKIPVASFIGVELTEDVAKKYLIQFSDAVIVKTAWQKREIEKIKPLGVFNLKDGFNIPDINFEEKSFYKNKLLTSLGIASSTTVFLSAGRFEDVKNYELTINAFEYIKEEDVCLLIVGAKFDNSPYERKIIDRIKDLGLDKKIKFYPFPL